MKKTRRRAGKSKWRKQKHADNLKEQFMEEAKKQIQEHGGVTAKKKLKVGNVTSLFKIETEKNAEIKAKLDKNRFKVEVSTTRSFNETRTIKKLAKRALPELKKLIENPEEKEPEVFDLWGDSVKKVRVAKPVHEENKKNLEVPTLIVPHGGQSINPSLGDQKALMNFVVEQVELKERQFTSNKTKETKKRRRIRAKGKKKRAHLERNEKIRQQKFREKEERKSILYINEYKEELKQQQEALAEKRKLRASIKDKIKNGAILPTKRYLGKRRYQARAQDFKEIDEVEPQLAKNGATLEPLREQFDGIYRRGLLEPRQLKRKKRRHRLAKVKFHRNPNLTWKEKQNGMRSFGIIRGSKK